MNNKLDDGSRPAVDMVSFLEITGLSSKQCCVTHEFQYELIKKTVQWNKKVVFRLVIS